MLNKLRMFIGLAACILAGTLATVGAYAMMVGLVAPPNWWFILILLTGAALRAVTYRKKASAEDWTARPSRRHDEPLRQGIAR